MTKYEVVKDGGVDINGDHYDQGHELEFDTVPGHVQELIDDGSVAEVSGEKKAADADDEPELKSYKVLSDEGIAPAADNGTHDADSVYKKDETVELDPENEQTKHFVEEGFVEEITD